jgi:hypothetical protein
LDLFPPETAKLDEVKRFARKTKAGDSLAGKMASFYMLLCEANPQATAPARDPPIKTPRPPGAKKKTPVPKRESEHQEEHQNKSRRQLTPSLSLNLQVLISPDAAPEQIDKIFESMAKHLKDFG